MGLLIYVYISSNGFFKPKNNPLLPRNCNVDNSCDGLPTLYNVGEGGNATALMIPVSSTVIPLDDLPEFTVGLGFGFNKNQKVGFSRPRDNREQ
jgi:hypothetical protein